MDSFLKDLQPRQSRTAEDIAEQRVSEVESKNMDQDRQCKMPEGCTIQ